MSYLISRSDTMNRLRNYAEQKHCNGEVELANGILKAICFIEKEENIPTAYDVEKVVAELENMKLIRVEQCHDDYEIEVMTNNNFVDAIEIVRKGGV